MAKRYWLMKTEPDAFSIADLERLGVTAWEGVRNYQARNHMRDGMKLGDEVLFYHSSTKPPGVVGLARVSRESYPDPTAFDSKSKYFDPKSKPDAARWMMVDVEYVATFPATLSLEELRAVPGLQDMPLLRKGQRLSVQPVSADEYRIVKKLGMRARSR